MREGRGGQDRRGQWRTGEDRGGLRRREQGRRIGRGVGRGAAVSGRLIFHTDLTLARPTRHVGMRTSANDGLVEWCRLQTQNLRRLCMLL